MVRCFNHAETFITRFFFNPFNYIVSNRQGRIGKPIYKSFEELRSTADSFIIFLKSLEWKENLPGTESCLGGEQTQSNSLDTEQVHGKHSLSWRVKRRGSSQVNYVLIDVRDLS